MNEMVKKPTAVALDDFAGYTDEIEGQDDARASGRVIQSTRAGWTPTRRTSPARCSPSSACCGW